MTWTVWIALVECFLQLPIPIYWFVLHPMRPFWRTHRKAAMLTGVFCAWLPVLIALIGFRRQLFLRTMVSSWRIAVALLLIVFELGIFWRVKRDLGSERLVGAAELAGSGSLEVGGIYARIRHPRYTASFIALLGACLMAGARPLWLLTAGWTILMFTSITLEERELRMRFGVYYEEYCRRVPRFLPRLR